MDSYAVSKLPRRVATAKKRHFEIRTARCFVSYVYGPEMASSGRPGQIVAIVCPGGWAATKLIVDALTGVIPHTISGVYHVAAGSSTTCYQQQFRD